MITPAHNLITSVADKISLPDVYHRIRDLIVNSNADIDHYVNVISCDSSLATRIIKIANSCFFGYSRKVSTVKEAISLIGVIQLHDLVLSSLAIRAFSGIPKDVFNQETFWRSSVYCGITARLLAKKSMLPASERLFASALLHEIGHIVMYAKIPEQVQDVLIASEQNDKSLYLLEREKFGFDYGQVGSEIMRLWHLPESYCDIASYHMEPEKSQHNKVEVKIVNLARSIMLAEEMNQEYSIDSVVNKSNSPINKELTKQDIETIKIKAWLYVDEVMDCLLPFSRKSNECVIL
ncbi:MAG: HDOD domain-containing protein [Methylococcales bacterium]|nr:HDOD domain-containing protein [Methylococcales bacterium]